MRKIFSQTTAVLSDLGLTETESTLYIAGLEISPCTAQLLAQKTHVKRPTVYHALETLRQKGLLTEKKWLGKTHFVMVDPDQLRGLINARRTALEDNEKDLETIIPFLSNLRTHNNDDVVAHHHGVEGAKLVMDVAFRAKSKHWNIIAPYHNFLREHKELAEQYLHVRSVRNITARTLWELRRDERKLTEEEISKRNPRILPDALSGKFESMIIIFDDKIAIFSSHKNLSAILITSSEIHALFLAMFEGLWELSTPY